MGPLQVFNLVGRRSTRCVAYKAPLARLEELLGPAVIEALGTTFATAQLCNAAYAAQTGPDLLFR